MTLNFGFTLARPSSNFVGQIKFEFKFDSVWRCWSAGPSCHTVTSPQQQSGGWLLVCWLLATVAVQCCHTLLWQTFIDRPDNPDMWSLFDDVWNGELESEILGESINQYLQTSISSYSMCLLQELCTLHILNIVKHCVHVCYRLYNVYSSVSSPNQETVFN